MLMFQKIKGYLGVSVIANLGQSRSRRPSFPGGARKQARRNVGGWLGYFCNFLFHPGGQIVPTEYILMSQPTFKPFHWAWKRSISVVGRGLSKLGPIISLGM